MAILTNIQWCDSSLNLEAGCEGCELIKGPNKELRKCYAAVMTDRYQGLNGWPEQFEKPKLFLERLPKALKWSDLTGKDRPDKPWLNGYPRIIFLNDMGDTFTKGLPEDWLAEVMPAMAASPHIYMVLTKWPSRMAKFSEKYPMPPNFWPGTTVTNNKTKFRITDLSHVQGGSNFWVSAEPLWENVGWRVAGIDNIKLMIFGGESGNRAPVPCNVAWIDNGIEFCRNRSIAPFVKQLGAKPYSYFRSIPNKVDYDLKDGHGGDWDEWPTSLKIREFPKLVTS